MIRNRQINLIVSSASLCISNHNPNEHFNLTMHYIFSFLGPCIWLRPSSQCFCRLHLCDSEIEEFLSSWLSDHTLDIWFENHEFYLLHVASNSNALDVRNYQPEVEFWWSCFLVKTEGSSKKHTLFGTARTLPLEWENLIWDRWYSWKTFVSRLLLVWLIYFIL